jgi:hypothetical protein
VSGCNIFLDLNKIHVCSQRLQLLSIQKPLKHGERALGLCASDHVACKHTSASGVGHTMHDKWGRQRQVTCVAHRCKGEAVESGARREDERWRVTESLEQNKRTSSGKVDDGRHLVT